VTLIPTRTDPAPGSGGVAIREMRLDGETVYPLPVATSDLSVGGHELATLISDAAGNSAWYTQSFAVTTSFSEVRSLLDGYVAAGTLAGDTATDLRAKLGEAEELAAAGDAEQAVRALNQLDALVLGKVDARAERSLLSGDVRYLVDDVRGRPHPEPELGLTSSPASPPEFIPDPVLSPLSHNPNAKFDVLVYSETTGFRHDHIPHTILAIQKLGAERGFNVDVYDPQLPLVSLTTSPFLSLDTLQKYETIVFESTVGHTPGPLDPVTERPNMEKYMQAGGGYVGLHGAADPARGNVLDQRWPWYGNLVGGWFTNHPGGQSGFGHCGSCIHTEVVTEDHEHPATAHLDDTWMTVDELYNFDRDVRTDVHTLLSLNEATYQRSLNSGNAATVPLTLMGGDHPIAWCQNWDGGKAFSNILGHARWQYYDATFMKIILGGIETTADQVDANCWSYRETRLLVADLAADGSVTAATATAAGDLLGSAQTSYVAKEYTAAAGSLNSLRNLAKDRSAGSSAARAELLRQADALRGWMLALNAG
jgi:type 1 glutamine amidotransferase